LYSNSLGGSDVDKAGRVLVAGAGGFVGGHLVANLRRTGHSGIRVVDCKLSSEWQQVFPQVETIRADLRELSACRAARRDACYIFNVAPDMGGMGFIETHKVECMFSDLNRYAHADGGVQSRG
jgi:GDP-D-mannose 3',5'-epimerase